MSRRQRQRGFVLYLAVVIAALTMLWCVGAVLRVNHQTGATLHSYQKSEAYYLAKQAASRALAQMNVESDWLDDHTCPANGDPEDYADKTTPGSLAWVEKSGDKITLLVEAEVSGKKHELRIPILRLDDPSSKLYSLSPSLNGGPDVVSWATTEEGAWEGLPPLPGSNGISSITVSLSGDVFAVNDSPTTSTLWRYRTGQGWIQMPDLPEGMQLSQISCAGDTCLVGKGSDNSVLRLPLGNEPNQTMAWESVSAPSGTDLDRVKANPADPDQTYVTATSGNGPKVFILEGSTWVPQVLPNGVSNLSGGMTVDATGNVFVASNSSTPGVPATMYKKDSTAGGGSATDWKALPPVPAIQWVGDSAQAPTGFIQTISEIEADPKDGSLWVQWNDPNGTNKHNLVQVPAP